MASWANLFNEQNTSVEPLSLKLKMAVLIVEEEKLAADTIAVSVLSRFPLSKTPEVFTNAVLVHNQNMVSLWSHKTPHAKVHIIHSFNQE